MAQEPKQEERPAHLTEGGQTKPAPKDAASDEVMAIRKAAGAIAEVIDNPNILQRVRIG